jgi:hypothetical protein
MVKTVAWYFGAVLVGFSILGLATRDASKEPDPPIEIPTFQPALAHPTSPDATSPARPGGKPQLAEAEDPARPLVLTESCRALEATMAQLAGCDGLSSEARLAYQGAWSGVELSLRSAGSAEERAEVDEACRAIADGLGQAAPSCLVTR